MSKEDKPIADPRCRMPRGIPSGEDRMISHHSPSRTAVLIFGLAVAASSATLLLAETPGSVAISTPTPSTAPVTEFIGATTCLSCHQNQDHFKDTVHAKAMPLA